MPARQLHRTWSVPVLAFLLALALLAPARAADPDPGDGSRSGTTTAGTTAATTDATTAATVVATVPEQVRVEMEQHWADLGGAAGPLGEPLGEPFAIPGGARWDFAGGALFRADTPPSEPGSVAAVLGPLLERYDEYGGPGGVLGFPTGDAIDLADGGTQQDFEGGIICSSSTTGAQVVAGAVLARYRWLGGPVGKLGLPTGAEVDAGAPGSRRQNFQHGLIYWSADTGARDVSGAIEQHYVRIHGAASRLGLPTTGPVRAGAPDALRQNFERGYIYWSETTGAWDVGGGIAPRYIRIHGAASRIGLPVARPVRAGSPGAWRQEFQRGHIYWSRTTGAWDIAGAIAARYIRIHGAGGRLGLPRGPEVRAGAPGVRRQDFQRGHIYWSRATGARDVDGLIARKYVRLHGAASRIGLPTSGSWAVAGGRRQHFQRADLVSARDAGTARVRMPFSARAYPVTERDVPHTWRPGCPVPPSSLRMMRIVHRGWDGDDWVGRLVVHARVVGEMRTVFRRAHAAGFAIRRMVPADRWGGSDVLAMEHDSTNAFNCRHVTGNPYRLSQHSYGNAIDINSFENPYVTGSAVYPEGSGTYLNRSWVRKGMIVSGGVVARTFWSLGWPWGARWSNPDYQHFSSNGG